MLEQLKQLWLACILRQQRAFPDRYRLEWRPRLPAVAGITPCCPRAGNLFRQYPSTAGAQQWYPYFSQEATNPNGPTHVQVSTFVCPSDSGIKMQTQPWGYYMMGNYHAFFGGFNLGGVVANDPSQRALFGLNNSTKFADITDGTSNTMVLGEYLRSRGASNDQRGLMWGDQPGYSQIYTQFSPNTTSPDILYTGWCDNQPGRTCLVSMATRGRTTPRHREAGPGGVNAPLADGPCDSCALRRSAHCLAANGHYQRQ